ncbi:hypothetical protein LF65_06925 [Clostridium beijerinckii]|uniref:Uncharacterized protein n=1 Tax=Clostridium beijerinckii TaxID=1520 RepID=A0A140DML0_CLOBE|nr:hypothetical protein LF65_06925 [Clostridium beijerinckii]
MQFTIRGAYQKLQIKLVFIAVHFIDVYDVLEQLENDILEYWKNKIVHNTKNYTLEELIDTISTFYEVK